MHSNTTICSLFTRAYVLMLGLHVLAATYPNLFYPWRESSPRYKVRSTDLSPEVSPLILMSYELDSWSQYDNPEEGSAREGDIKERSDSRKTATTNKHQLWPNGVVRYFVDDTIVNEPEKLAILEDAMENIMESTCVRFVRIYPDLNGKFPFHKWVNITGNERGCYSDLGCSDFSPSNLNLDIERCFRTKGHAIHEILHTLGVFHEHMRPDRDKYIKILWNNIRDGDAFNFLIMDTNEVTNYGLPYDYDSIMHYSMTAFSKDKSIPTIVPRTEGATIGQRDRLSFYDVQKLLITYRCNEIDSKDSYHEVDQNPGDRVESLYLNSSESYSDPSIRHSDIDRSRVAVKALHKYRSSYAWNPSTKFDYSEYLPNPFRADEYNYCYYYE